MAEQRSTPGQDWMAVLRRPALADFAAAFADTVVLDTSAGTAGIAGAEAIRHFFDATRGMYEAIAFVHETTAGTRTCLEWEGRFQGAPIAGTTILARDENGLIESIRLYHRPYAQVLAFSAELARRLRGVIAPGLFVE